MADEKRKLNFLSIINLRSNNTNFDFYFFLILKEFKKIPKLWNVQKLLTTRFNPISLLSDSLSLLKEITPTNKSFLQKEIKDENEF